jgi:mannose-1-phosphate guanylyltransferase
LIGPDVVIGEDVVIEDGARIQNSALMKGTKVGKSSFIDGAIIGWHSKIGNWVKL